jgi:hypothetical protein
MQRSGRSTIGGLSGEYRKARLSANRQPFLVPTTAFGTAGRRSARGHPTEIDPVLTLTGGSLQVADFK